MDFKNQINLDEVFSSQRENLLTILYYCVLNYLFYFHFFPYTVIVVHCSVPKSCPTSCDPMNHSIQGLGVLHCLPEFAQIHIH